MSLVLDGYQCPASSDDPHDRNWLFLRGYITTPQGAWSFRDPCLLTWELPDVSAWLRAVVAGNVEPEASDDPDYDVVFLEPNIALGLRSRSGDFANIRVGFWAECVPPWFNWDDYPEIADYSVVVTMRLDEMLNAAAEWDSESSAFPERLTLSEATSMGLPMSGRSKLDPLS